jgi:phospholipid/cholesterol/gamma-HCH transport system substrate-binding protein
MSRIRAPLLVGLVATAGMGVFVLLYGTVQKTLVPEGSGYRVHADFDDVSGLASHSRVTISGIPVGAIDSIDLVTDTGTTRARVTVRLAKDIALWSGVPVPDGTSRNGATITRRTATMLGDYYLEISPGLGGERLKDGDAIPNVVGEAGIMALAQKMERVTDLFPKLQQIADDVQVITGALSRVIGGPEGQARLDGIAEDARRAANDVASMTSEVRGFISRSVGDKGGRVDRILANLDRFSSDAARLTASSRDSLARTVKNVEAITDEIRTALAANPGEDFSGMKGVLGRLQESLASLDSAAKHLDSIASKIDSGQGTIGRLVNDDKLITKTEEVVDDVSGLVKSVSDLETQIGARAEFYAMERTFKEYVSLRFKPKPDKYYLMEVVFDPRGSTTATDRYTLTNDPSKPPQLAERVYETTNAVKFSLEFAMRWDFFTGRVGLIESTGGLGMDFEFVHDSLKFAIDLFDLSADHYPRLRIMAAWAFVENFYVAAGADDLINDSRDYFVGLGFRFTDEDLKALLVVAPGTSL